MFGPKTAPVAIIGAGPTGMTAATLLAQYGVESLVLDRWPDLYPQPRAVHLDHEVYRIVDRLGIADEFATISRPGLGLRSAQSVDDGSGRVPARPEQSPARTPRSQHVRPTRARSAAAHQPRAPSGADPARQRRSHRPHRPAQAAPGSPTPTGATAACTSVDATTSWAATAPTAWCAPTSDRPCGT